MQVIDEILWCRLWLSADRRRSRVILRPILQHICLRLAHFSIGTLATSLRLPFGVFLLKDLLRFEQIQPKLPIIDHPSDLLKSHLRDLHRRI